MTLRTSARRGLIALTLAGLAAGGLSACAEQQGPGYYSPYQQGRIAHVEEGTIVSFRPVQFGPGDTGGATIAGGVGGALIGNAVAGGRDRGPATVLGALGGALIGNAVASGSHTNGFAYTIRRSDGRLIEIAQADPQPIPPGTRVAVSYGEGRARVSPIGGYDAPPPPPPPPPPGHY